MLVTSAALCIFCSSCTSCIKQMTTIGHATHGLLSQISCTVLPSRHNAMAQNTRRPSPWVSSCFACSEHMGIMSDAICALDACCSWLIPPLLCLRHSAVVLLLVYCIWVQLGAADCLNATSHQEPFQHATNWPMLAQFSISEARLNWQVFFLRSSYPSHCCSLFGTSVAAH